MRRLVSAALAAAAGVTLACAAPAAATPAPGPFVDHTEWAKWGDLSSLRVYPTPSGRSASGHTDGLGDTAWLEVLALAPDAAIPGMREQFMCHWELAELFQPGKTSWNLEPWRPEVDDAQMVASGCNPGGTEEPF